MNQVPEIQSVEFMKKIQTDKGLTYDSLKLFILQAEANLCYECDDYGHMKNEYPRKGLGLRKCYECNHFTTHMDTNVLNKCLGLDEVQADDISKLNEMLILIEIIDTTVGYKPIINGSSSFRIIEGVAIGSHLRKLKMIRNDCLKNKIAATFRINIKIIKTASQIN